MSGPVYAFFDFDGTLTTRDTLVPFLRQLRGSARFMFDLAAVSPWLAAYAVGLVANDRAKERLLTRCLRGLPAADLARAGEGYARESLPALQRADLVERLRWHQEQGHLCVLVSASPDVYLRDWAAAHGVADVLCTALEHDAGGRMTGRLQGRNCYGEEKVRRIRAWLQERVLQDRGTPAYTYAYGDTRGDLPMLHFADEGYRVRATLERVGVPPA